MTSNKIISVEELWQFYNLSANLVCITGKSGYLNHINPTFAQLLDFTEEELIATPYLELIHPEDRESTSKEINELKNGKTVTSFQNRHRMKSGNYKWLSWTANRSNADGNIYAIGLDCSDIMPEEKQLTQKKITEKTTDSNEKEWVEIAKELRDNINHLLQKSPLHVNVTERDNTNNYSFLLHSSVAALNAIGEIKKLSATLTACLNKETGFADNITALIEETMAMHPVKIKYAQSFSEGGFNKKLKQNILKIVREQLNNILKHSLATSVQINLEQISNKLFLSIQDNGVGYNKAGQKTGKGISNIISYAKQYKGEVLIDTAPGKGCTLSVTFIDPVVTLN